MRRPAQGRSMPEVPREPATPRRVVVVGAGVAALECVLALRDLAEAPLHVTLIAPETAFTLRPLDIARPLERRPEGEVALDGFMTEHGGRFRRTAMVAVDTAQRAVRCTSGPDEPYDTLVVAVGAPVRTASAPVITFGEDADGPVRLLAELEREVVRSIAFVVPTGCAWPLPLYELALMLADRVCDLGLADVDLRLVTPERAPLDLFGMRASAALSRLLGVAGIAVHADTGAAERPDADRVVTLPVMTGPRVDGLPADVDGFVPVDDYGRVLGVGDAYAAGDAADHPIKQGELTCQQAHAVATHIAAAAGGPVDAVPYVPALRGRLMTGPDGRFDHRPVASTATAVATRPLWWPYAKVPSRYLAPYLERHGLVDRPLPPEARGPGVDVRLPLGRLERRAVAASHQR